MLFAGIQDMNDVDAMLEHEPGGHVRQAVTLARVHFHAHDDKVLLALLNEPCDALVRGRAVLAAQ
jgi:hypothetical protein